MIKPITIAQKFYKAAKSGTPAILSKGETEFIEGLSDLSMWKQRAALGATALFMQTSIDAANPHIDKDTKKFSVRKTFLKVITCAGSGMAMRFIVEKKLVNNPNFNKYIEAAINKYKIKEPEFFKNANIDDVHQIASKIIAALAGISTVVIDTPVLNWLIKKTAPESKNEKSGVL